MDMQHENLPAGAIAMTGQYQQPLTDPAEDLTEQRTGHTRRDFRFWMVFCAGLTVDMLSALDLSAVSVALPTIVNHLHGSQFIWAGSAYSIAATAILPLIGGLVSMFGRKWTLVAFVLVFALGSAICGGAQSMNMLIGGRVVQGLGGGACIAITEIVYADLVPLPERGKFQGITALVWAFAREMYHSAVGPPIGGALADTGAWRWLFFLNLPLCGIAIFLILIFLTVHTPQSNVREKVAEMDWLGCVLVIGSTVSLLLALTWGGIQFPWGSFHVLVPLVIGIVGLATFIVVEARFTREPTMPKFCFTNRTTLSGYLGVFFHGVVAICVTYYLPVYFQAGKGASAVGSGVDMFGKAFTIPAFAIFSGLSVEIIKAYRPQNYVGWMLIIIGYGTLTLLDEGSSRAKYIGLQIPLGIGLGIVWISTQFPILAPLPYSNNARALGFFTFTRSLAQSLGIVVGGTILQNELRAKLPEAFLATLPQGVQIAYSAIPQINALPDGLREEVRGAFAGSVRVIWQVLAGISGAGLLTCFLMEELPLRREMDETWGLQGETDEVVVEIKA
ncbi:MFS general substrate transporter [Phanerochaete sordida]|uniref:MFS general substrate transporter n=1 Tax=Phanerochaete sordida TaxID=48140 RepID=A0A9P3G6W9_9APHY|nr:MFS general substrate transporter [Phanerochaete sordida]